MGKYEIKEDLMKSKLAQWDHLYDSLALANGAFTGVKSFFQTPKGQGSKTISDTNLNQAGQLSRGNRFQTWYLGAKLCGTAITGWDTSIILLLQARAAVEVLINNIVRMTMPFSMLPIEVPTVMTVQNQAVAAATNFIAGNRYAAAPAGLRLEKPIGIEENESFEVRITFDDSVTLANMASNSRLLVYMSGLLNKPAA